MKPRHHDARFILPTFVAALLLVACKQQDPAVVTNPTLAWCGNAICSWQTKGKVAKVPTWHPDDFAVSLEGSPSLLTQYSQRNDTVSCLQFSIMGQIDDDAELTLELDFQDDGKVELVEHIPASDWQTFHYLASTPDWFDGVRITLRKRGRGRAVLSLVDIEASGACTGERPAASDRLPGVSCHASKQCLRGECVEPQLPKDCKTCARDSDCGGGNTCLVLNREGCDEDAGTCSTKVSGLCDSSSVECWSFVAAFNCSDCSSDSDCASGELCIRHERYGVCRERGDLRVGELCARKQECASALCKGNVCVECSSDVDCPAAQSCMPAMTFDYAYKYHIERDTWFCDPGKHQRAHGAACLADADCKSGACTDRKLRCTDGEHFCDADFEPCDCGGAFFSPEVDAAGRCK